MADTTTVLNPGAGGDSMDEALVTQNDGTTQAKRARVDMATQLGLVGRGSPVPMQFAGADREVLCEIRDLLRELVKLGGGIS